MWSFRTSAGSIRRLTSAAAALTFFVVAADPGRLPIQPAEAMIASRPVDPAIGFDNIDHLIFVVQENRSFDHYFGTFPGANGKILFDTNRDGNSEIYVMDADGSNPTNLTNNAAAAEFHATWSADGTKIAFVSTVPVITPTGMAITAAMPTIRRVPTIPLAIPPGMISPLATAVMVILAIPFVFKSIRSGGFGRSLFVGIMLGLAFFVFDKGFGLITQIFDIAPLLGAFLPTALFAGVGAYFITRVP